MIHPKKNTQAALQQAIEKSAEEHLPILLSGEYPIGPEPIMFRHPDIAHRPGGFIGTKLLGGGPSSEVIEPMKYMNWGGASLDWQPESDGVIMQADGIYQGFDGVAFYGKQTFDVIGVAVPYLNGWGTGQHSFERCGFHNLKIAVKCGENIGDSNCDQTRLRNCMFNRVGTVLQTNNWQSVDHLIDSCSFAFVDTVFDIVYGGKICLRWPTLCWTKTLFRVHNSSYQLNTFVLDGASIDAGGHPPVIMESSYARLVRVSVANVHCSHPHTERAMFNATDGQIEATLRSVHTVGRLCEGNGEILVVMDACTLTRDSLPFWNGGLTSGWLRWKDGQWVDKQLKRIG